MLTNTNMHAQKRPNHIPMSKTFFKLTTNICYFENITLRRTKIENYI
jgi:hypothetical protein